MEFVIANLNAHSVLERQQVSRLGAISRGFKRMWSRIVSSRRFIRFSLVTINIVILATIAWFAVNGTGEDVLLSRQAAVAGATDEATEPLDQLSSADIAANAALAINLAEITPVINQADSTKSFLGVTPANAVVIAKPQAVATPLKSNKDIKEYVVQSGETVSIIAGKFSVTSDSIMWSNNLRGNTVNAGAKLLIPPVNGLVYIVKAGDTVDSLAQKYRASKDQIIAYNDIELTGLKVGARILIPNGQPPTPVFLPTVAVYGPYNGYDYGFCTWYVANRRAQIGSPVPSNLGNASTWDSRAVAMGVQVNKVPSIGAAAVTSHRGAGHVAFVEMVNADGSIWISEMNSYGQVSATNATPRGGWGVVDWKLVAGPTAATYNYIH